MQYSSSTNFPCNCASSHSTVPSATLFSPQTGQLYHPSTGLLFNPIGNQKFDPYLGKVITENGLLPAHPNLVYLPPTNSTSLQQEGGFVE